MKALVTFKEMKEDCAAFSIEFDAADLETIKNAVNQWRVNKLKEKIKLEVISIVPFA